jgi:hypothetical protein
MPDDTEGAQGLDWLIEPPGTGEVYFQLAVGDGVEAGDEVRQVIDHLLQSLLVREQVEGYAKNCWPKCLALADCGIHNCSPLNNCTKLIRYPCAVNMTCQITKAM